ncbi:MAG: DUF5667 domain-containing protein [Candidatus Parvarchaeota archaeon]|nr:DUF5667 domain-containing protein [Candidatus Jingweiarchaeum tengchongense]MCW1297823.1 DUF5667 domain-containing protein [Candidatus Jingweiarchaeum tengchongense]MCW1299833.1 DUF5667 domain-containing protein [Candidatus Jingweiarchaeum tengchongense]MCW1304196.1 DUF5667 domain-containing protein [Candidatus Jingweiarchaeum tengchongense]MCW1305224.1 DUF5667 domain-containing protein [Candidatus Jingweiarchaeum tengchongense]
MLKKIMAIVTLFFVLITIAHAQENETDQLPTPWILPDSPLYGVKRFIERLQERFIFREQVRAQFHLRLAEMRLAEIRAMQKLGKLEKYQNLIDDYEDEINKTEVYNQIAVQKGQAAINGLLNALNATEKHITILLNVKNKTCEIAPNSTACLKASFVIERASRGHERILQMIQTRQEYQAILNRTRANESACIQVITYAMNPKTGNCMAFPTPCDVPPTWRKVDECPNQTI